MFFETKLNTYKNGDLLDMITDLDPGKTGVQTILNNNHHCMNNSFL